MAAGVSRSGRQMCRKCFQCIMYVNLSTQAMYLLLLLWAVRVLIARLPLEAESLRSCDGLSW